MKHIKLSALLFCAIVFASCSITTHYIQDGSNPFPASSPEKIKIYSGDVTQPYTVIGSVAVLSPGDGEKALDAFKDEAASIGADAVIWVKLEKLASNTQNTGLSGTAIRFKK
jgi:hypothetical protein